MTSAGRKHLNAVVVVVLFLFFCFFGGRGGLTRFFFFSASHATPRSFQNVEELRMKAFFFSIFKYSCSMDVLGFYVGTHDPFGNFKHINRIRSPKESSILIRPGQGEDRRAQFAGCRLQVAG